MQPVSGRNKCSSYVLCYWCVQLCAIHNCFALYCGGVIPACWANKAECQWTWTLSNLITSEQMLTFHFLGEKKSNILVFLLNHIIFKNFSCGVNYIWKIRNFCLPEIMCLQGALSGLRSFLATESPLKIIKNAFYFTSKALFIPKIVEF